MKKYDHLFWDIDGTILDFLAAEKAAIRTLFREFGFGECSDEALSIYSEINKKYWQALERKEVSKPYLLVARFRDFFEMQGLDISAAEEFNRRYQSALGDTIVFHDNAPELLKELSHDYVQTAVTNGTAVAQRKKLSVSGLDQLFDHIFISELVGHEKPDPRFFDAVTQAVGASDRSRILIIGDSLTSDILGGINSGIDTCLYDPEGKYTPGDIRPDHTITELGQIRQIIRR